ncbi:uncharacterized protein PHACADRAFT_201449 [Phanerochaete carnosa HHB-10118-sp]|uniref:DNA-directed RNA polymerase III subunit RPC9 n=1 Tax=Phanerochaete carnosa (strain HHB-10118-sp) TaxID=650164 RepID=K5UJL5_PHACS|nr:uncharacterized protein PHACADRAFT_201449 [Phanerochaete carnosa HHB-10118-sp]EKM49756.1 hypothetical protein PHACADRAFT_201449 [Phanerochaete carnosa HHB-10118-sp]
MEVIDRRSALLSNYEVLTLLRELESDHLAKARTALRIKKEEEASGSLVKHHAVQEEVCENLRTIEVEAIQYLSADYQPTGSQSENGIVQLTKSLATYDLTKAEKLQVVNLAPTEPVELYVVGKPVSSSSACDPLFPGHHDTAKGQAMHVSATARPHGHQRPHRPSPSAEQHSSGCGCIVM